jgi:hypothetical protein
MRAPVRPERAARLYRRLNDELARHEAVLIVCRVDGRADLSVVGTLARITLMATRRQVAVRVTSPCSDLRGLLALTGLASVVTVELESAGQPEAGEEGGVEEVVDVDDLTA